MFCRGPVSGLSYRVGDGINVRLVAVDIEAGKIDFIPIQGSGE